MIDRRLKALFKEHFGVEAHSVTPMPQGGSDRRYFRLLSNGISAIGAYNPDVKENGAFFYLTNHFLSKGFNVPQLLRIDEGEQFYLLSDLGNQTLFNLFLDADWSHPQSEETLAIACNTIALLARLQVEGAQGLDFSNCYPKSDFDEQSVMWDFNYFKYSFLKPSGIPFNETLLESDFEAFAKVLLSQPKEYFHFRDFQSRNVMLVDGEPYFIDYQGGRRGPLLYDVVSFIYQARANLPQRVREQLVDCYFDSLEGLMPVDREEHQRYLPVFALFRAIQTLGAYGYRGFFERRAHFLQSIPFGAANIEQLLPQVGGKLLNTPHLFGVLRSLAEKYAMPVQTAEPFHGLTLEVCSFSFLKGYPTEHPVHGGGYVFDCRALPNPGRIDKYKMQTGRDAEVIAYLDNEEEVQRFYAEMWDMVSRSIERYVSRGFKHLSVSFGCTGGQHRSVYMARRFAQEVARKFENVKVSLTHREIDKKA